MNSNHNEAETPVPIPNTEVQPLGADGTAGEGNPPFFYFRGVNEGRLAGSRVFRVESLIQRPEYVTWLKESLSKLKRS